MASLIEELITVLQQEEEQYHKILELSKEKTGVISSRDIDKLREFTEREQEHLSKVLNLEKKREGVVKDIAIVLNKDVKTLKIKDIVGMLENQKEEQKRLSEVRDGLNRVLKDLQRVNDLNARLVKESQELLEFDMNLLNSAHQAPQTANYSRRASNVPNSAYYGTSGGFDAKQ